MLPKDSSVPKSFNSYFRFIPGNIYLFKYLGTLLGNISSFSKRIYKTKTVVGKFKLHPSITMHIFPLTF